MKIAFDPEWKKFTSRLIKQTDPSIVPIYFYGCNSIKFQLASHLGDMFRASLLFHEVKRRIGSDFKFIVGKPFKYSNIDLYIFAVNLTEFTLERFSYKTHPDMSLLDAIYMTCSLPFIFQPKYIENNCYIVGGVINPYPMNICIKDLQEINPDIDKKEILGFKIIDDKLELGSPSSSIFQFGFYMIYRLIKENYNYLYEDKIPYEIIIPSSLMSTETAMKIIVSKDERRKLLDQGEKYAKLFLTYIEENGD